MSYREGPQSYIQHNGKFYLLDKLFELTENQPSMAKRVSDFAWVKKEMKEETEEFKKRVLNADLRTPILAIKEGPLWIPLDGFHRVCKAVALKKVFIRYRLVTQDQLKQAEFKRPEPKKEK